VEEAVKRMDMEELDRQIAERNKVYREIVMTVDEIYCSAEMKLAIADIVFEKHIKRAAEFNQYPSKLSLEVGCFKKAEQQLLKMLKRDV
jgi:hypothetical protein